MKSIRTAALSLGLLVVPAVAWSQPSRPVEKPEREEQRTWVPLFQRHAREYVVRLTTDRGSATAATWISEPVLRWSQPVRGGDDGALYLWCRSGRPVTAITFFTFKWPDGKRAIVHERHSLSLEPVAADWRGRTVWQTARPGLAYVTVPEAPGLAKTTSARMRQMQAIIRDFSAHTIDDKEKNWPLRLLPRPLYRFEGSNEHSLDGALYALAQGTDPEAFLLLDARRTDQAARWEFAVARFTDRQVEVRFRERKVYAGKNGIGGSNEVYHSETVILKPSDDPKDFE